MECKRQVVATSFNIDIRILRNIRTYLSYVESILNRETVNICFIGIANNDNIVERLFFRACVFFFTKKKWKISVITAYDLHNENKTDTIYKSDIIFVGGGKTSKLMTMFNETGFSEKLRDAYQKGVIMGGVSAGLLCWFKHGITDSFNNLSVLHCLDFIHYSTTPHYQIQDRKQLFDKLVKEKFLLPGYGVPDGSIVHFVNEQLIEEINLDNIIQFVE